jgi:hypothetical protein
MDHAADGASTVQECGRTPDDLGPLQIHRLDTHGTVRRDGVEVPRPKTVL